ncbi:glycosyltransferase family 4 protein [Phenylobacterium sp.]|uniref:glycosyltransferase family 4 protein n=1 Tax=Phenylobacterium sp. TaxID=1871053 RepID=UPI0025FF6F40|nr:glycosyltransferase family 4 protein [Phenylobacterium sp.]
MLTALREEFDVKLVIRRPWAPWFDITRRVVRRVTRGAIDIYWWPAVAAWGARRTIAEVSASDCDITFAVAITPICAELTKRGPTIFVSDATLASMANYYPRHKALAPWLKKAAAALESFCIQNARAALFPSEWASRSAVRDHGGSQDRVVEIAWGANLVADEAIRPESRSEKEWRLLFVGADWSRKGGDIVLETVSEMRRRGYSVHVDVVGSCPPSAAEVEGVTYHGFLDKNVPADDERMKGLFATAHVFFLPTQFEALGIVFAEAASYALPTVSYRTGGVPSIVHAGQTGVLLEEGASAAAFADELIALLSDRRRYVRMSYAALAASREELNWAAWAVGVREMVEEKLGVQRPAALVAAARRRAVAACGTTFHWRRSADDDEPMSSQRRTGTGEIAGAR